MPLRNEVIRSYSLIHPTRPEMSLEVTFYTDDMALAWIPILLQFDQLLARLREAQAGEKQTEGPAINSKGH